MEFLNLESAPSLWDSCFVRPLLGWYDTHARVLPWRSDPTPYHVWISEIMLQQTRVDPAIPYYLRFMRELPDVAALAACEPDRLNKLWEGLGYYSRARNLHRAAQQLLKDYGGEFPRTVEELTRLPGIGDYTAGAILSIAFSLPVPAVDGNVIRVLSRMVCYEGDSTLPAAKEDFRTLIHQIIPSARPGDFNQALMDLGATICRPHGEPRCSECPVYAGCRALAEGRALEYPRKPPKKERRVEERTVLLVITPQGVLLHRRGEGLLAGMWEYPNLPGFLSSEELSAGLSARGLTAGITRLAPSRHLFTHLEWKMQGYLLHFDMPLEPGGEELFVHRAAFEADYAIPNAFKKYTHLLHQLDF